MMNEKGIIEFNDISGIFCDIPIGTPKIKMGKDLVLGFWENNSNVNVIRNEINGIGFHVNVFNKEWKLIAGFIEKK